MTKQLAERLVLLGAFLFGIYFLFFSGDPADADTPRVRAGYLLYLLNQQKPAISQYAVAHKSLEGAASAVTSKSLSNEPQVQFFPTQNGTLVVVDLEREITVIAKPELRGGKVVWSCSVLPAKASPAPCRQATR